MPRPRRSNLSRQSRNARRIQNTANERTEEEQEIAREQLDFVLLNHESKVKQPVKQLGLQCGIVERTTEVNK